MLNLLRFGGGTSSPGTPTPPPTNTGIVDSAPVAIESVFSAMPYNYYQENPYAIWSTINLNYVINNINYVGYPALSLWSFGGSNIFAIVPGAADGDKMLIALSGNNNYSTLVKLDATGHILWQKRLFIDDNTPLTINAIARDATGNLYLNILNNIVILAADGSQIGQLAITLGVNTRITTRSTICLSGGDLVTAIALLDLDTFSSQTAFIRYTNTGSVVWTTQYADMMITSMCNDGSDNICALVTTTTDNNSALLILDADGNQLSCYEFVVTTADEDNPIVTTNVTAMTTSATGVITILGLCGFNDSSYGGFVLQMTLDGVIAWGHMFNGVLGTAFVNPNGCCVDSDGNVYIISGTNVAPANTTVQQNVFMKLDNTGALVWQFVLDTTYFTNEGASLFCDTSNNIYASGRFEYDLPTTFGVQGPCVLKLPRDDGNYVTQNGIFGLTDATMALTTVTPTAGAAAFSFDTTMTFSAIDDTISVVIGNFPTTAPGGMLWIKDRDNATDHVIIDSFQDSAGYLATNTPQATVATSDVSICGLTPNGFYVGSDSNQVFNTNPNYMSWGFARCARFFDLLEYIGNDTTQSIAHNLACIPGMILIKAVDSNEDWIIYHNGFDGGFGTFDTNAPQIGDTETTVSCFGNNSTIVAPTITRFTIGANADINSAGVRYTAYLFAHDTTDGGLIQCGNYTTTGSNTTIVELGWEPQYLLFRNTHSGSDWQIIDNSREFCQGPIGFTGESAAIAANTTSGEVALTPAPWPIATGFVHVGADETDTYIYMAIRRQPMTLPIVASPNALASLPYAAMSYFASVTSQLMELPVDLVILHSISNDQVGVSWYDRLRGPSSYLDSTTNNSEIFSGSGWGVTAFTQLGYVLGVTDATSPTSNGENDAGSQAVASCFSRTPTIFDMVLFTDTGTVQHVAHNLAAVPALIIIKNRSSNTTDWHVYHQDLDIQQELLLNTDATPIAASLLSATPTEAMIAVNANSPGDQFAAYLFGSADTMTRIGSYTGNGASQAIDCGFTNGSRFLLIKRIDATGNWLLANLSGSPLLYLNTHDLSLENGSITINLSVSGNADAAVGFVVNETDLHFNTAGAQYVFFAIYAT